METKTRILIADANPDFRSSLTELISQEDDMEVVAAVDNGVEALSLAAERKADVLLTDLVLLQMDGLELLRRLPETGVKLRSIVLSGFVSTRIVSECSALGADYFIPKPCELPMLLERIRALSAPARGVPALGFEAPRDPSRRESLDLEAAVTDIIHEIGVPAHI